MAIETTLLKNGGKLIGGSTPPKKTDSAPADQYMTPIPKADLPVATQSFGFNLGGFDPNYVANQFKGVDFSAEAQKKAAEQTKQAAITKAAKLDTIKKESTDVWNTAELGFQPLKNKVKEIWKPSIPEADPVTGKVSLWSEMKSNFKQIAAPTRTVLNAVGAGLDFAWDNSVGRLTQDMDSRKSEVIAEDTAIKTSDKFLKTEKITNTASELSAENDTLNRDYTKLQAAQAEIDALEGTLKTLQPWDTNYVATKKLLTSKKFSVEQAKGVYYTKVSEFEEKRNAALEVEAQDAPITRGYYKNDEEAKKYRSTVLENAYRKDGKLYGIDGTDKKQADAYNFMVNLESRIFNTANGIDENYVKAGLDTKILQDDKFLNLTSSILVGTRDAIEDNYDNLTKEIKNSKGEMVKVLDGKKVDEFLSTKYGQYYKELSDYISDVSVDAAGKSMLNYHKNTGDDSWAQMAGKQITRAIDLGFTANTHDVKDSFGMQDYKRWIKGAAGETNIAGDIISSIVTNPAKSMIILGGTIASFGTTSLAAAPAELAAATEGVVSVAETAAALTRMQRISAMATNIIGKGSRIISAPSRILGAGGVDAEGLVLSEKIAKFGLGMTKNPNLDTAINFMARKGAGVLDEFLVSLPSDLALSEEGDLKWNVMFNTLGGLGKISKLDDISNLAVSISRVPDPIMQRKLWDETTGLLDASVDFTGTPLEVEKKIKNVFRQHQDTLLGTDKSKIAVFMMNYMEAGIDKIKFENIGQLADVTKAVENNPLLKTTLSKTASKDINNIIKDAEKKLSVATTVIEQDAIKASALDAVKKRFKRLATNFDVNTLNKWYKTNISKEFAQESFSSMIKKLSSAVGVPEEDMAFFMAEQVVRGANMKTSKAIKQAMRDAIAKGELKTISPAGDPATMAKKAEADLETVADEEIDTAMKVQKANAETPEILGAEVMAAKQAAAKEKKVVEKPVPMATESTIDDIKIPVASSTSDVSIPAAKIANTDEAIETSVKARFDAIDDAISGLTKTVAAPKKGAKVAADVAPKLTAAQKKLAAKEEVVASKLAKQSADTMFETSLNLAEEIRKVNPAIETASKKADLVVEYVKKTYGLDITNSPVRDVTASLLRPKTTEYNAVNEKIKEGLYKISDHLEQGVELKSSRTVKTVTGGADRIIKDASTTEHFEESKAIYNKYTRANNELQAAMGPVNLMNDKLNSAEQIINASLSKVGRKQKGLAGKVIEGVQNFMDIAKNNGVIFAKAELPDGIRGMLKILDGEVPQKIILGLSGKVMESLTAFGKIAKPSAGDFMKVSDDLGTLFHEMGHLVSANLDPAMKTKILEGMRSSLLGAGDELRIDNLKSLVGDEIFKIRFNEYKNIANEKDYNKLMEEVFADKLQKDMHSAIFTPEAYDAMVVDAINFAEKSGSYGLKDAITRIADVVKSISTFFKRLVTASSWMGNSTPVADLMTMLNFAVIKGEADLAWGAHKADKGSTFFQKVSETVNTNDIPGLNYITAEQGTLLRMGLREEALKVVDALKNKKDLAIRSEFLNTTGIDLMMRLIGVDNIKPEQLEQFLTAVKSSKQKSTEDVIAIYHMINKMYDPATGLLLTNKGGRSFSDLLKALPVRLTKGMASEGARGGGVISDNGLTIIKYMMEADAEKAGAIMQGFYNTYFKKVFGKSNNEYIVRQFISHTNPSYLENGLNPLDGMGDGMMKLYGDVKAKLYETAKRKNIELAKEEVEDILNPMLYSPIEYIGAIGRMDGSKTSTQITDIVLANILNKRRNYASDLGLMTSTEMTKASEAFDKLARGAAIRNKLIMSMGPDFTDYLVKNSVSIPLTKSGFGERVQKTMGYFIHNDNLGKGHTIVENMSENMKNALNVAGTPQKLIDDVDSALHNVFFHESGAMTDIDFQRKSITDLKAYMKQEGILNNPDVSEIFNTIESSLDPINAKRGTRILSDYLLEKIHKTESYKLLDNNKAVKQTEEEILETVEDRKKIVEDINKNLNDTEAQAFVDDFMNLPETARTYKNKKGEEIVVDEFSKKERLRLAEDAKLLGLSDDQMEEIRLLGGVDVDTIIRNKGELSAEDKMKYLVKEMVDGKVGYHRLINQSEPFRNIVRDSLDDAYASMAKKENQGYYSLDANGVLMEKFDGYRKNWFDRLTGKMVTIGKLTQDDPEDQAIMGRMIETRQNATIRSDLNLSEHFGGKESKYHTIDSYVNAAKKEFFNLTYGKKGVMKSRPMTNVLADETVGHIVNSVFGGAPYKTNGIDEQKLFDFLQTYKRDVDQFRSKLGLGDVWFQTGITGDKGKMIIDKVGNRMSGMWNYMNQDDITRLGVKFGKGENSAKPFLANFLNDIVFGGRADKSENSAVRGLNRINNKAMKIEMTKMFGPWGAPKMFQQIFSNVGQADGIIKATIGTDTSALRSIESLLLHGPDGTTKNNNFAFDLFKTEGTAGESVGDIEGNWNKIAGNMNVLMRGDKLSQKSARLSSLALALEDIYKAGGSESVTALKNKVGEFYQFMTKYNLKETDFLNAEKFKQKMTTRIFETIDSSLKSGSDVPFTASQLHIEKEAMYDFYKNTYSPLMGKVRTNMGVFYVMDNIPELGSIRALDQNRWAFGLMKRAMGKTGEYAYDVRKAFRKYPMNAKGIIQALNEPIFTRIASEITSAAKIGWFSDRLTNGEMSTKDVIAAIAVPRAAFSMLIGDSVYKNVVEYGLMGAEDRGDSLMKGFAKGVSQMLDDIAGRALLYVGLLGTDMGKIVSTANSGKGIDETMAFGFRSLWKQGIGNTLTRYSHFNSAGYQTRALGQLNINTILSEYLFNTASDRRKAVFEISNHIYGFGKDSSEQETTAWQKIGQWIPGVAQFATATPDQGVLMAGFDKYKESTGIDGFIKTSTPASEVMRLIDILETNTVMNDEKFKGSEFARNDLKGDNLITFGVASGAIKPDMAAFKVITDGLEGASKTSKDLYAGWMATMTPEQKKILSDEFDTMFQNYLTNKDKGEYSTGADQQKFIALASKFGGTMAIGGYMKAYANGFKKKLADYYGLKPKEISAAQSGDALFIDAEYDFSDINSSSPKFNAYVNYVKDIRSEEKALINNNRDWIQGEKHIGIDLMNKYIENDVQNFPLGKYGSDIGAAKSNFSKLMWMKQLDTIGAEQGYPSLLGPISYLHMKGVDFVANMANKSPEGLAKASKAFINIQKEMLDWNNSIEDPVTRNASKAGLAAGVMKWFNILSTQTPEIIESTIAGIGEAQLKGIINRLTDSPPSSMATAFEQVTGKDIHSTGKGGSISMPAGKFGKKGVDQLMAHYNKLGGIAARSNLGDPSLPPKYKYVRNPDGSIEPIRITVEPIADRGGDIKQIRGANTETAKLDVKPLPIKEGRVLGGSYGSRAIKGAKVYSRKIGGKKL